MPLTELRAGRVAGGRVVQAGALERTKAPPTMTEAVASRIEASVSPAAEQAATTRVVLVTDIRLYREGIEAVLERRRGIRVVGAAGDRREAVELAARLQPEIVLVDMAMSDAVVGVKAMRRAASHAKILALTVAETEAEVLKCIEAGVSGYVTRESSVDDLVAAIERAGRDEVLCSPRIAATLVRRVAVLAAGAHPAKREAVLTSRELEIVALIDVGLSNKEIARRLVIEVNTVKNHVHHILEKLQVHRRADAAAVFRALEPFVSATRD